MDHLSFLKAAEAGQVPPVVLLHGPEPFLLDEAVARVTRGLFGEGADLSLARETLDAQAAGAAGIVQAAQTLPWTGARRLVVARGVDALGSKQAEPLAAYIAAPNPSTALLVVAGGLLEAGHWLVRATPASAVVVVPRPSGRQLTAWLRARGRADGVDLAEDAADLLVALTGEDLARLAGELQKATLAGGASARRVSAEDVRSVVGEQRARRIFELTDAIVRRETARALQLLEALLGAGEEAIGVVAVVTRDLRLWWELADGLRQGRSDADLLQVLRRPPLRRPPGVAQALIDRARGLSPEAAARALERCWTAERRLKLSSPARPEVSLLVAELCAA